MIDLERVRFLGFYLLNYPLYKFEGLKILVPECENLTHFVL